MAMISRRAFVTATAASVATPDVARGRECPAAGMDWMTMSLEARNLAYNNGEHVGLDFARVDTAALEGNQMAPNAKRWSAPSSASRHRIARRSISAGRAQRGPL